MMAVLLSLGTIILCFLLFYALIQIKIKPQQKLSQRLMALDAADAASAAEPALIWQVPGRKLREISHPFASA